jgi:hypothetical protein
MARSGPLLTDAQWEKIRPLLPKPPRHLRSGRPRAPDRVPPTAGRWKAFCGFCGAGPAGRICRGSTRIPRRAGGGCGIGRSRASG